MKIIFDEEAHSYKGLIDGKLEPLLNASTFKEQYTPEFNMFPAAAKYAKNHELDPKEVMRMWNLKGKASRNYGSGVHETLEGFIKYTTAPVDLYLQYFLLEYRKLGIKAKSESREGCERLRIAGILALVDDSTIYDLKTGNFKKKPQGKLLAPFNFLPNNPLGQATLQLNYYRLFEGNEDKDLKVLFWNGEEFEIIELEKIDLKLIEDEIIKYNNEKEK